MLLSNFKVAVAKFLTLPLFGWLIGRIFKDRIKVNSVIICTTSPLILNRTKAALFWGLYERAEIRFLQKYLPIKLDVVELGSSIGVVSAQIGKIINGRRLVCVEANPSYAPIIERNLILNNVRNFKIYSAVLSTLSQAQFRFGQGTTDGQAIFGGNERNSSTILPTIRLSELLQYDNLHEYSLVCDIEGAEFDLLLHDPQGLNNCVSLIIEAHSAFYYGRQFTPDDIVDMVAELNFRLVERRGPVMAFRR